MSRGREELALLDVHRAARLRGGHDQIGLPREERRDLQDVDDRAPPARPDRGSWMSVSTGTPVSCLHLRRARAGRRPGRARGTTSTDVRFALSNDALKISGTPQRRRCAPSARAMSSACDSLSMTQGPAMRTSGAPSPTAPGRATHGTPEIIPETPEMPGIRAPDAGSAPRVIGAVVSCRRAARRPACACSWPRRSWRTADAA